MRAIELMAKAAAEPGKYKGKKYKVVDGAAIDRSGDKLDEFTIDDDGGPTSMTRRVYVSDVTEVEEIQQEIPFLEAVQAHNEGKTVMVKYPDFNNKERMVTVRHRKESDGSDWCDGSGLSFYVIRTGKWYVL